MQDFTDKWSQSVISNRILVLLVSVILLFLSAVTLYKFPLKYDNSFEMFMLKDDPNIELFENFRDLFGDAEYLTIGVEARQKDIDLFNSETIAVIHEITTMLENHEYVSKVNSLSKYQYTHSKGGLLSTDYLFPTVDEKLQSPSDLSMAREIIVSEPLAINTIVTEDLKHARIIARTEYIRYENDHKVKVSNDIYNFLKKNNYEAKGYKIRLGGGAIISERFETLSRLDTKILNPIVAVIFCVILYFLFGSILVCLLPWVLIGCGVLFLRSLQALFNFPMTVVTSALLPTLMIIGMGVSVHILSEFFNLRKQSHKPIDASRKVIKNLFKPILFTALTTSMGFIALSITNLLPVKQYALLTAVGSLLMFLVSMTTFIAALTFITWLPRQRHFWFADRLISSFTEFLPMFVYKYRGLISIIATMLVCFCCITVPKITVDSNIFNYFKANNWVTEDMYYFDEKYKFSGIELIIDSGVADGIKAPIFLQRVEELQSYLNSLRETGHVNSAIDYLKQTRQALNENNSKYFLLPETSEMTAQLLMLYINSGPDDDLSDQIDFQRRYLRIGVPVEHSSANQFDIFFKKLTTETSDLFPTLKISFTGPLVLYNAQEMYINSGLKNSFALALLMIWISFLFLFRSLKYGIIALFPSILPILIVGGSTIFMGISLDLGTIIVGAMTMGIAVDDAIHVMSRYIKYKSTGKSTDLSISLALKESGKPVIFTSIILVFGFSAMLFASLIPTILFGFFVALIMALAVFGDLIILPALLYIFDTDRFLSNCVSKKKFPFKN